MKLLHYSFAISCALLMLAIAASAHAAPYSDAVLADGPVSYWTFDEGSIGAAPAADTAPFGTATAGAFVGVSRRSPGIIGAGTSMHTNVNSNGVNVGTTDFTHSSITVEALINTNWDGSDLQEIFRKEDGGNRILLSFQPSGFMGGGGSGGAPIGAAGNAGLSFGINVPGAGGYGELDIRFDGLAGRPSIDDARTGVHHVAATYDQATGDRSLYWDGVLIGSVNNGAGNAMTSGGGAAGTIGNISPGGGEPFSGLVDELAIYNSALSAPTVASHAALGTAPATSVSLSSDVLGPGNFGNGYTNNSTVDLVSFIGNSAADPLNVAYNQNGDTIDLADFVTTGATAGNLGSNIHGRGSTLFLPGDGETIGANNGGLGIGAHANWLVTFDLSEISDDHFGGADGHFELTGRFGMNGQGSVNETVNPAGMVQGLVFLDGVLIDQSPLQDVNDPSHPINLALAEDVQFLTFAILNGENSDTFFDDGTFRDLTLTHVPAAIPEPTSFAIWSLLAIIGLGAAWRSRARLRR